MSDTERKHAAGRGPVSRTDAQSTHVLENGRAECVTHFTEELDFLSEEDKDWIMRRAILERFGWS
jgi:hypothetical protein